MDQECDFERFWSAEIDKLPIGLGPLIGIGDEAAGGYIAYATSEKNADILLMLYSKYMRLPEKDRKLIENLLDRLDPSYGVPMA